MAGARAVTLRLFGAGAAALVAAVFLASCGGGKGITPVRTAFNRGVYLQSSGDDDGAITEYRQALRENPDDYRARFNLAVTLEHKALTAPPQQRQALTDQAEQEYREILSRKPDDLRASVNLAALIGERGEASEAHDLLARTIERNPGVAAPRTALGARQLEAGDVAAAEVTLREAVRVDAGSVAANYVLATCYVRLNRPDDARAAYNRALATDAADLATLIAMGRLELDQGRPLDAAAALRRALLVDGDNRMAHLLLADALERVGDLDGAAWNLVRARALEYQRPPEDASPDYSARLASLYKRLEAREQAENP